MEITVGQDAADPSASSSCSDDEAQRCFESNRLCQFARDGEEYACGSCLEGYIEFTNSSGAGDTSCVDIDGLTWDGFEASYSPVFRVNDTVSTAERLELLISAARFIAKQNSAGGEDSEYTLGLTPNSVDTEEEYVFRSGYFYVNLTEIGADVPQYNARTIASADLPNKIDWVEKGGMIVCRT